MAKKFRYRHITSAIEDRQPQALLDGEIAVNKFAGKETLFIKNTNSEIVPFSSDSVIDGKLATKQNTLVSGTNIKTINNQSLLGEGNITIEGSGSTQGTKVYLDPNNGSLTTEMLSSTSVVYVISYDYAISSSVTVPSGCTFEFAGGSINNGTLVLDNTYLYGNVKFGSGITISGTCKNDVVYQNWFANNDIDAWHRFINNVDGPTKYEYAFGEYTTSVYVSKELDNKTAIFINGNNAIVKFQYTSNAQAFVVKPKNQDTFTSTTINSEAYKGDETITVGDGSLFNAGDVVSVRDNTEYSFSPHRSSYKQCEFATIRGIEGNVLRLGHPLMGSYIHLGGSSKVYGFNQISCNIKNLTIKMNNPSTLDGKFQGLVIYSSICGKIENVKVTDFRICSILSGCHNMSLIDCVCHVTLNQSADFDSYGISFGGCQNISVIGGDYIGGNHALSIGGANNDLSVIGREILVKNIRANSIKDGFPAAIDMHGCAEYVTIEGCTTAGIYMRGKNNKILNNFIYDYEISGSEFGNFNHIVSGNIMKTPSIAIGAETITDRAGWVKDSIEDTLVISNNCSYDQPYVMDGSTKKPTLVRFITTSIDPTYYNIDNTVIIVENNNIRNAVNTITGFKKIVMKGNTFEYDSDLNTTVKSKPKLTCSKLFVENNRFIGYGHYPYYVASAETKTYSYNNVTADYVYIKNNYIESSSADTFLFEAASAITELYVEGNIVKDKFLLIQKDLGTAVIRNNTIEPAVNGINISASGTVQSIFVLNNIVSAKKSIIATTASKLVYGRNILIDTYALTPPHFTTATTATDLDSGGGSVDTNYSAITYAVSTTSDNGNTSGSVTIDGTKPLTILTVTGDITSLSLASGKMPVAGHSAHVMLTSSAARNVTIVHNSTSSVCPSGSNVTLSIPADGFVEVDFINVNNKIYVRGI